MRRFLFFVVLLVGCVVVPGGVSFGLYGGPWMRPVAGPVVRGFDPPAMRFGPGHLGVDFGVPPGTAVRAAGDGTVVFAGRVGDGLHVVVLHADDVRTTDSFLASIAVVRGQHVARGEVVGTSGGTGPQHASDVLHFGVRVGDEYIDPMLLFAPPDLGKIVHLAEPHGGSFGAGGNGGSAEPSFVVPPSANEAGALVAAMRVDARPSLRAPSWWPSAARPPTSAPAVVNAGPPPAPDRRVQVPMPVAAAATAIAAPAGAFTLVRRRRRGVPLTCRHHRRLDGP